MEYIIPAALYTVIDVTTDVKGDFSSYVVTTAPNATVTPYDAGRALFWWPVTDTVISKIEMYNTD